MKKLITSIDDVPREIFIDKDFIGLEQSKYEIRSLNGSYQITDSKGIVTIVDDIIELENNIMRIEIKGYTIDVLVEDPLLSAVSGTEDLDLNIISPLAGSISNIFVKEGQNVEKGDVVIIISAMKMENKITAKSSGMIKCINVKPGDQVNKGTALIELEK